MKTWQEQFGGEIGRLNAVCDSLLKAGGSAAVRMEARDKVCEAIGMLVLELKKDEANRNPPSPEDQLRRDSSATQSPAGDLADKPPKTEARKKAKG